MEETKPGGDEEEEKDDGKEVAVPKADGAKNIKEEDWEDREEVMAENPEYTALD